MNTASSGPVVYVDPLHDAVAGSTAVWTRANVGELLPAVVTPLTCTTVGRRCETAGRAAWRDLGVLDRAQVPVPSRADDRQNAFVHGRMCLNLTFLRQVVGRIPGADLAAFEEAIGVTGAAADGPRPGGEGAGVWRAARLAAPFAGQALTVARRVDRLRVDTEVWWRTAVTTAAGATDRDAAIGIVVDADRRLHDVLRHGIVASLLAQGVYGRLAEVAARAGRPGFETSLVTGYGDLEEQRLASDLRAWAAGRLGEVTFLARHGYQCPEQLEVAGRSWREDPARLVPALAALAPAAGDGGLGSGRHQAEARRRAEADFLAAVPSIRRPAVQLLLRVVRTFVLRREVQKVSALQVVDGLRAAARSLGRSLVRDGIVAAEDDVVFLTFDELTARRPVEDAAARVDWRRARQAEHAAVPLPHWWVGAPPVIAGGDAAGPGAPFVLPGDVRLAGVPSSPGVVEGLARVINDPSGLDGMEAGEILVCRTTDPSWTPALLVAAAVVVDRGGPLSHGAIVARELGVPCVSGTAVATERVRTGDRVRVDGTGGTVEILLRSEAAPCPD